MIIEVKVKANAKADKVEVIKGGSFKVETRTIPEKGKANESVVALLARYFGVPKAAVRIIRGHTSSRKFMNIGL